MAANAKKVVPLQTDHAVRLEVADNLDFMRGLAAESMHFIVTSPPYNIGKRYEKRASLDR